MARKRVLVCDDDAYLRTALSLVLARDYEVLQAGDGKAALRVIESRSPDLVILDISMPGMTGMQTLAAYRERHPSLRTIVLTAKRQVSAARKALSLGAVEYVTKPFDPDYIKAEVARLLEPAADARTTEQRSGRPWRVAGPAHGTGGA